MSKKGSLKDGGEDMVHFASDCTTEEIIQSIKRLLKHKVIRELDLLLKELQRRKLMLKKKILTEMCEPLRSVNKRLNELSYEDPLDELIVEDRK